MINRLELRTKINDGVKAAFDKLVISSAKNDENLIFAKKDGKIFSIPAKKLLKVKEKIKAK
ncbi:MAG: hypothetical protein WCJ01_11925 [Ignavibacteria bacterium]